MKKIYREFLYVPKYENVSDKVFKTRTVLSLLTCLVCFGIFCSTTFAWFNCNRSCEVQPIQMAEVSLNVQSGEWNESLNRENHATYTCSLAANDTHSFKLTNIGTASTAYCVINVGGKTFNTLQIAKGESIELMIQAAKNTEITFSANWGEYVDGDTHYGNGDCIEISTTPYETYKVAEGATLELIAEHYAVSVEEILSFNNITELVVGMEIKIPNTTVTEPFVLEEPPITDDVATPSTATPSDAEETVPNETETTQPTETEGEEVTDQTVPTETETTEPVETEQTEESTETETATIATEAPAEETTPAETEAVLETEATSETIAASIEETIEPTAEPEPTATEETASAAESETNDAQ